MVLARLGVGLRRCLAQQQALRLGCRAWEDASGEGLAWGRGESGSRGSRSPFSAETSTAAAPKGGEEAEGEGGLLRITDACVERVRALRREKEADDGEGAPEGETSLRIRVDSGGCSGFQYSFELDSGGLQEGDLAVSKDGVQVIVDDVSAQFLKGATVDYTEELIKSSFEITANPNAESSCGCGNSFVPT